MKSLTFILTFSCLSLYGNSIANGQDIVRFCREMRGVIEEVTKAHPGWALTEYPGGSKSCGLIVYREGMDDVPDPIRVSADLRRDKQFAIAANSKYRESFAKIQTREDLTSQGKGWSKLERVYFAHRKTVVFGAYKNLTLNVLTEDFAERDRIIDFILKFDFEK